MAYVKELQNYIEVVMESLENAILDKKSLLDPEIVYVSEQLDSLLNEYSRINSIMEK